MSYLNLWKTGAVFVSAGMIMGAFGAHGLRKRSDLTADKIHAWETASNYAIYNGLALLLLSMNAQFAGHRFAGPAIAGGGAVFSGTIWSLVIVPGIRMLGPITPMSGTVMIAGYISLIL